MTEFSMDEYLKCVSVIDSCKTMAQLDTAKEYCKVFLKKNQNANLELAERIYNKQVFLRMNLLNEG